MEILLKIVKRTQIILTKNRKNTQNLKKHFFISLQKCNNSRLLFILKKKKIKGRLKKKNGLFDNRNLQMLKKHSKINKHLNSSTNLFSLLEFNEEI